MTIHFFFLGIQEKLGILNNGVVYAVYDYTAHNNDELSFNEGDRMVILRKGDEMEREWWWSRLQDKEGYVPRNLLGVRWKSSLKILLKFFKILNLNFLIFLVVSSSSTEQ